MEAVSLKHGAWFLQVFFLLVYALLLKSIAIQKIPFEESLIVRGITMALLCLFLSCLKRESLIPKKPRFQLFRLLNAGFALYTGTLAYHYLSATSIALIARLDLFWILSFERGKRKFRFLKSLSFLFSLCLLAGVFMLKLPGDSPFGIFLGTLATALITWGYFFAQSSRGQENMSVAILTPSLALIFFGFISFAIQGRPLDLLSAGLAINSLSGAVLFMCFFFVMRAFDHFSVYWVSVGTLIATIGIAVFEPILFGSHVSPRLLVGLTVVLALSSIPIWIQSRNT